MEATQTTASESQKSTTTTRQSTSSKRASTLAPKPPLSLASSTVIAGSAQIIGIHPVTIGAHTIIHPHARINSTYCAIDIGSGCIISEKAQVGLSDLSQDSQDLPLPEKISIGDNVRIEANCVVEAASIGDFTTIDVDAKVGAGAVIGKHCSVTACSMIPPGASIPDFTVVMVDGRRRKNTTLQRTAVIGDIQARSHDKHLKVLERLVPDLRIKFQ